MITNYREDLNIRNRLVLDILCIVSGRNLNLIYPTHDSEAKYPNILTSTSTFTEKIICTEDAFFWLINSSLSEPQPMSKSTIFTLTKSTPNTLSIEKSTINTSKSVFKETEPLLKQSAPIVNQKNSLKESIVGLKEVLS